MEGPACNPQSKTKIAKFLKPVIRQIEPPVMRHLRPRPLKRQPSIKNEPEEEEVEVGVEQQEEPKQPSKISCHEVYQPEPKKKCFSIYGSRQTVEIPLKNSKGLGGGPSAVKTASNDHDNRNQHEDSGEISGSFDTVSTDKSDPTTNVDSQSTTFMNTDTDENEEEGDDDKNDDTDETFFDENDSNENVDNMGGFSGLEFEGYSKKAKKNKKKHGHKSKRLPAGDQLLMDSGCCKSIGFRNFLTGFRTSNVQYDIHDSLNIARCLYVQMIPAAKHNYRKGCFAPSTKKNVVPFKPITSGKRLARRHRFVSF